MTDFRLRHGEAVAIGVAIDTVYSSLALGLPASRRRPGPPLPARPGLRARPPGRSTTRRACSQGLEEFRQHLGGRLTLTMLRGVGDPIDVHEVDPSRMRAAIERVKALAPPPTAWDLAEAEARELPYAASLHPMLDRRA